MKAISSQIALGILLVSLLGFLGCSGSNDGTSATLGEAIPVSPFGILETPTPTYEWTPVPGATKYRLMVQDTNEASTNQDAKDIAIIDEWYTAEEAGCASEDVLCMVTPDIKVFEEKTWKVQACANHDCGMWSDTLDFFKSTGFMVLPRFTDNGDDTVTDNNTKLTWTKNADLFRSQNWFPAQSCCEGLTLAGESDWRLPELAELKSLTDIVAWIPCCDPPNHPFENVSFTGYYWTSTVYGGSQSEYVSRCAWIVNFFEIGGYALQDYINYSNNVWCVRGTSEQ